MIQSTGREFQRCSKCKVACYCSKACQAKAWTNTENPHKCSCKITCQLIELGGGLAAVFAGKSLSDGSNLNVESVLADCWLAAGVPMQDMLLLEKWCISLRYPYAKSPKRDVQPGYEDYEAKVEEMLNSEYNPNREGEFVAPFILDVRLIAQSLFSKTIGVC